MKRQHISKIQTQIVGCDQEHQHRPAHWEMFEVGTAGFQSMQIRFCSTMGYFKDTVTMESAHHQEWGIFIRTL